MSFFGLDIGTSSFKVLQASAVGPGVSVEAIGAIANPIASIEFSDKTQVQRASDSLKKLLGEMGLKEKRVVVGISEQKVYSRVVSMPAMPDSELASAIAWEAEQFVPVPIAEVEMDYAVVRRAKPGAEDNQMLVYLLASPKKYLNEIVEFVVGVGLEPIAIESEMAAAHRVMSKIGLEGSTLTLNVGASSSAISIAEKDELLFTYVLPVGGIALTRALSQALTFPLPQAEEYKRTYGLDGRQFEGKIKAALMPVVMSLVSESRKAIEYYASQYKSQIARIVLSGGGAYLPEFVTHISGEFPGIEVVVADPFTKFSMVKKVNLPKDRASYMVVSGLSLREI
jgi:type IV pilus assembly protein PilM